MKFRTRKSLSATLVLPLLATSLCVTLPSVAHAEEAAKPAKATRAKSHTETGQVTEATATSLKYTGKEGPRDIALTDKTEITRVETGLSVADLKAGDTLALTVPGTNGRANVQSLAPLTLQFDNATITFSNADKAKFNRVTKISATDLAAGQDIKVVALIQADGSSTARTVQQTVGKTK